MVSRCSPCFSMRRYSVARSTPELQEFTNMAKEQGMKAAIAWRDSKLHGGG